MANALSDRERSTMGISYGSPYDPRNLSNVRRGMEDAYINAIQAAPEWLLEQMAPEDPYTPGILQSGPRDRIRALGLHREQDIAQRRQELGRDYEQGIDYGTALSMVADPYLDLPLAGIPAIGKALKLRSPARSTRPFNALGDLTADEAGVIRAYHGTPHEVDKFRMANIGTGEGAQAYGHGLYFAESPDVAKSYAPRDFGQEAELMDLYKGAENRQDHEKMELYEAAMMHETPNQIRAQFTVENGYPESMVEKADQVAFTMERLGTQKGGLYEVDLDVNPEDLIDWDKGLNEQPQKIQEALAKIDPDMYKVGADDYDAMEPGAEIYTRLVSQYGEEGASKVLAEAGIPGIRYFDQMSRSAGKGSRNVVMFDEDLVSILGKE